MGSSTSKIVGGGDKPLVDLFAKSVRDHDEWDEFCLMWTKQNKENQSMGNPPKSLNVCYKRISSNQVEMHTMSGFEACLERMKKNGDLSVEAKEDSGVSKRQSEGPMEPWNQTRKETEQPYSLVTYLTKVTAPSRNFMIRYGESWLNGASLTVLHRYYQAVKDGVPLDYAHKFALKWKNWLLPNDK